MLYIIYFWSQFRVKPSLHGSIGSMIELAAGESTEDGKFRGQVIAVDENENLLRVAFDTEEEGEQFVDNVPWNSSAVSWLNSVPSIESCQNYSIEVKADYEGASDGEYYLGKVLKADINFNTILVDYEVNPGEPPFREQISFKDSRILRWIPPLRSVKLPLEDMLRPRIDQSVGSYVYLGSEKDPELLGRVVSFDVSKKLVKVSFLFKEGNANEEDIPYLSSELLWVRKKPQVSTSVNITAPHDKVSLSAKNDKEDPESTSLTRHSGSRKIHGGIGIRHEAN